MAVRRDELLLEPDPERFDESINRLIAGDERELLDRLGELAPLIEQMRASDVDRFDVQIALGNAGAAAAVALRRGRRGVVEIALDALLSAYRLGDVTAEYPNEDDTRLFEGAASPLWALGALAVEREDWDGLREVIVRQPVEGGYWATWLRHGQVMASRASAPDDDNLLDVAAQQLRRHPAFGMTGAAPEQHLRSLATFDHLAFILVAGLAPDARTNFYTSFAKYSTDYVEHAAIALRAESTPLRAAVFPHDNTTLMGALREANELAVSQASFQRARGRDWNYRGYQDHRTWQFIREGHMWEDWE